MSCRCPHNMVNFGPLAAEIVSLVWGTSANFNGFHVLAALLHSTLLVGVSQTAALNRGCNLYSAGRPSCWALAHISSWVKKCIEYEVEGSRPRGRPKRTWKEVVQKDCQARNLNKEDAMACFR